MSTDNFSIQAHTYTLKENKTTVSNGILDCAVTYNIPIYQRPYSWKTEQIQKLLSDIFVSFYGHDKKAASEPLFIGTMQLSGIKANTCKEVIDGQQRLTTILILLKQLAATFPNCASLCQLQFNWLTTAVHNGEQEKLLEEYLTKELPIAEVAKIANPYQRNARIVQEFLDKEELKNSAEGKAVEGAADVENNFNIDDFVTHLFSNMYFVVIETTAGLSKTLQIFDAINTTGLDLNGSDVFKIRMFEYLKDVQQQEDTVFTDINKLYAKVDQYNKEHDINISFHEILDIYQDFLISKHNLSNTLYSLGVHTFFERLFDTLLKVQLWDNFKHAKENITVHIAEIDTIIECRFQWFLLPYPTFEDACMMDLWWWSRYSRYWKINILFLYHFPNEKEALFTFINRLSKLYFLYSIYFERAIGDIATFSYTLMKKLFKGYIGPENMIKAIENKIKAKVPYYGGESIEVCKRVLNGNIAYNRKKKDLICRLSAILDEEYQRTDDFRKLRAQFFYYKEFPNDIEHIQPQKDENQELRDQIIKDWGSDLHSIGNLILLERSSNRSIGNKVYTEKRDTYSKSCFQTVKSLAENHKSQWTLEDCQNRKTAEIKKLTEYLF